MCTGSVPSPQAPPPVPEPVKQTDAGIQQIRDDAKKKALMTTGVVGTDITKGALASPNQTANILKSTLGGK